MITRRRISIFISSLAISFLLAVPQAMTAQNRKKVVVEQPDTVPFFNGFAVFVDVVGSVQLAVSDYGQYEAGLRVNLKDRYFPTLEVGLGKADHLEETTLVGYKTSALYGKIGCDFNLVKNKHDIYRILGGVRYAYTSFKYDLSHPGVTDPVWGGESPYGGDGISCSYHWMEFLAGVDAKIWGPLHLGWTVRYRKRIASDEGVMGNAWYVPGFGKTGNSCIGGTFTVTIDI